MWFKISSNQDRRFPLHHKLISNIWLSTDQGWEIYANSGYRVFVKGYCHELSQQSLVEQLIIDPTPRYTGSFIAVLEHPDGTVSITNDTTRASPMYHNDFGELGNIGLSGPNVWSNSWIQLKPKLIQHRWSAIPTVEKNCSFLNIVNSIDHLLTKKFNWLREKSPIKVFYSGGIDTLTCIAYLRGLGIPHTLITNEYFDHDHFTLGFNSQLKSHWGYTQIHHWLDPSILITGACGDVYFMRNSDTVNLMLQHMNLKLDDVLKHDDYQQNHQASNTMLPILKNRNYLNSHILNMYINSHEHWHLGNTLTFTPFKDINILSTVLGLNDVDLVRAMMDATIQKELINRHSPELMRYLPKCKNKNQDYSFANCLSTDLY